MKKYVKILLIFLFTSFLSCSDKSSGANEDPFPDENPNTSQKGSFVYTYAAIPSKPIPVFYYLPSGTDVKKMKILIVLHGDDRNAKQYRDIWITYAERYKVLIFAPEFSETDFPGGNFYILGNVYQNTNNPTPTTLNPEEQWTFSIIEPLFDKIRSFTNTLEVKYDIYGHSGGGQFAHRLLMLKPNLRVNRVVSSNGGWFTVADAEVDFPYGLANSPINLNSYQNLFSKKLIVQVGEPCNVCTNGLDPNVRHNTLSDMQGLNRIDRAEYFFEKSKSTAQSLGLPFNWEIRKVQNAYHDEYKTTEDAAKYLYK